MKENKMSEINSFVENVKNISFTMIFVKGGTFKMGDESDNLSDATKPIHDVNLPDFYIGKYPVTQKLWNEIMGINSNFKGENNPVENVSWNNAHEFLIKLNLKTGKKYRLPDEAEWEFAARGGNESKGYKFAGSNNINEVAEYEENNDRGTMPVGGLKGNELGIYDMSGNVWEWCQDKWHYSYENAPSNGSAWETGNSSFRVRRGGGWYDYADNCHVATRRFYDADFKDSDLGFSFGSFG